MILLGLVSLLSSSCRSPRISGSAGVEEFSPKWPGSWWLVFSLLFQFLLKLCHLFGGAAGTQAPLHQPQY